MKKHENLCSYMTYFGKNGPARTILSETEGLTRTPKTAVFGLFGFANLPLEGGGSKNQDSSDPPLLGSFFSLGDFGGFCCFLRIFMKKYKNIFYL